MHFWEADRGSAVGCASTKRIAAPLLVVLQGSERGSAFWWMSFLETVVVVLPEAGVGLLLVLALFDALVSRAARHFSC